MGSRVKDFGQRVRGFGALRLMMSGSVGRWQGFTAFLARFRVDSPSCDALHHLGAHSYPLLVKAVHLPTLFPKAPCVYISSMYLSLYRYMGVSENRGP